MNKSELRETLENLRADLANLKFRQPQSRERVQQLISAIERQIENSDDVEGSASVRQDLSGAISQFESEHPTLAGTLGQIASALSSMGI
jgi:ABC-type transporter Mla subunit MlaD